MEFSVGTTCIGEFYQGWKTVVKSTSELNTDSFIHMVMMWGTIAQKAYNNVIRDRLPRKFAVYAGVPARGARLFDVTDQFPHYKPGLLSAIEENVEDGDHVELVGFGRGVSTVKILEAGAAHVTAHEASQEMIAIGNETLQVNGIQDDAVTVNHTLVGEAIDVYGGAETATVVSPSQLSDADVLVLDCEGAESSILDALGRRPETIIVETHPECGVPPEATRTQLVGDYDLDSRRYSPTREAEKQVVTGTLNN